jgi:hypothetical protein
MEEGFYYHNVALAPNLSDRLRLLCQEVLDRLPEGWNEHREIDIEQLDEIPAPPPSGGIGYASCLREEEGETLPDELPEGIEPEQIYLVTLYRKNLDRLSDKAVQWAIAHELAHAASGLPTGSIVIDGIPYTQVAPDQYVSAPGKDEHEDTADGLAMQWGFTENLQCFLSETETSR